jgi:hypothetical protein
MKRMFSQVPMRLAQGLACQIFPPSPPVPVFPVGGLKSQVSLLVWDTGQHTILPLSSCWLAVPVSLTGGHVPRTAGIPDEARFVDIRCPPPNQER